MGSLLSNLGFLFYGVRLHFRRHRRQRFLFILFAILTVLYVGLLAFRSQAVFPPGRNRPFLRSPWPLSFAHRGASAYRTENMLPSFALAKQSGVDILELDVHMTKDGVVVVHHDADLTRVEGKELRIKDLSYAELKKIPIPSRFSEKNLYIPTLEEVFRHFPDRRINIEIKHFDPPMDSALLDVIRKYHREDTVLVGSVRSVSRFRELSGGRIATSASAGDVVTFLGCYILGVPCHPDYDALQIPFDRSRLLYRIANFSSPEFIAFAHRHSLGVHFWTVSEESDIKMLLSNGADGVMSNYPDRILKVEREMGLRK